MIKATGLDLRGLEVVMVGHSEIVGKPAAFKRQQCVNREIPSFIHTKLQSCSGVYPRQRFSTVVVRK